jgi:hypothetical protein
MANLRADRAIEEPSATSAEDAQQRLLEHRRNADRIAHQKKRDSLRS